MGQGASKRIISRLTQQAGQAGRATGATGATGASGATGVGQVGGAAGANGIGRVGGATGVGGSTGATGVSNDPTTLDADAIIAARNAAEQAEQSKSAGIYLDSVGGPPEMPPDLIKFLNDAGPLQRSIDKDRTSPKVYEALVQDENARNEQIREQTRQANVRTRRKMPIVSFPNAPNATDASNATDAPNTRDAPNDGNDGTTTLRTTNFSTTDRSDLWKGFGLTKKELFDVSLKLRGVAVDSSEWKEKVGLEFKELQRVHSLHSSLGGGDGDSGNNGENSGNNADDSEKGVNDNKRENNDDLELLQNTLKYIAVPVLMKEPDGEVVGVWSHKLEALRLSDVRVVPENSLEFIMNGDR